MPVTAEPALSHLGRWFTVIEVAGLLRKSEETIRRWCRTGLLQGARTVGRSWLIPETALAALLTVEAA